MSLLAAVRPDSWNFPLFVHVTGAMLLVGGVLSTAALLGYARGDARLLRLGYWTLLAVGLPGYVLMRVGAEWLYAKYEDAVPEGLEDPGWIGIGYIVADAGALLLLAGIITGGIGVRRLQDGKGSRLLKTALVLCVVLLAALVVATWAMSGKPG